MIILAAIALALAPLLHFAPTKQQRKVAALRETAALNGLFVEFRNMPAGIATPGTGARPIYYGKRLPPPRAGALRSGSWLRDEEGWRGAPRRLAVPSPLTLMPQCAAAAGMDEGSCGIYWQEAGQEGDVEEISRLLGAWAQQLSS